MKIYIIGSLRNPIIPELTKRLMDEGFDAFSEWAGAGEKADDAFKAYHQSLGRTYLEALKTDAAKTIFEFDKKHIDESDTVILITPAGRSCHVEFGYAIGQGKRGYYLLDDPERWDLMLQFSTGIFTNLEDLIKELHKVDQPKPDITAKFRCRDCGSYSIGIVIVNKDCSHNRAYGPISIDKYGKCQICGEELNGN